MSLNGVSDCLSWRLKLSELFLPVCHFCLSWMEFLIAIKYLSQWPSGPRTINQSAFWLSCFSPTEEENRILKADDLKARRYKLAMLKIYDLASSWSLFFFTSRCETLLVKKKTNIVKPSFNAPAFNMYSMIEQTKNWLKKFRSYLYVSKKNFNIEYNFD